MWYQRERTLCAVILVCFALFGAANENNLKFVAACGGNRAYKKHDIGSPSTANSAIECGTRCSRDDRCHSYTFNKYSRLCHLSSGRAEACDLSEESGSKYMEAVSFGTSLLRSFLFSLLYSRNEYFCHGHANKYYPRIVREQAIIKCCKSLCYSILFQKKRCPAPRGGGGGGGGGGGDGGHYGSEGGAYARYQKENSLKH